MKTENSLQTAPQVNAESIQRFVSLVRDGIEAWTKAGMLLVQMAEANPNTYQLIMKQCPTISIDVLLAFEAIGRRRLYPNILLDGSPGCSRLKTFSYEDQVKYFNEPVDVVTSHNSIPVRSVKKNIQKLSRYECDQVMEIGRIRSVDEQVLFLKNSSDQKNELKKIRGKISHNERSQKKSLGFFKIVRAGNAYSVVQVSDDSACFALPLELIDGESSEPFELKW